MKPTILLGAVVFFASALTTKAQSVNIENMMKTENLTLVQEWDKTFPQSEKVNHSKVSFLNRYGITLAADLYVPKNVNTPLPAIAVCGPFGAVKEQAAGLYAQEMAERGFITLAFDPSFTGESGGLPRYMTSPDINTEDFSAAVDFLVTNPMVKPEEVGIIGICGWGGIAINAAAADPRIKATVASTMYDMSRVNANGYFDSSDTAEARDELRIKLAQQRTEDFRNGSPKLGGGVRTCFPKMRLNSSRIITTTTRPSAAIIPVAQLQRRPQCHIPDSVDKLPADEPCRRNRKRCDDCSWRKSPLVLFRQ